MNLQIDFLIDKNKKPIKLNTNHNFLLCYQIKRGQTVSVPVLPSSASNEFSLFLLIVNKFYSKINILVQK